MNRRAAREASRTCLLVTGMHRSGTSALARVLSLLGADLPTTLMGGSKAHDKSNQTGHWESATIARLNDEMLDSAGVSWRSAEAIGDQWFRSAKARAMKRESIRVIDAEFDASSLFILKDPRISKLLPIWLEALAEKHISPKAVVAIRSPREVAESLHIRNGIDPHLGELLWAHYVLEAEHGTRGLPRLFVSYDALLQDWRLQRDRIARSLDVKLPRQSDATDIAIDRFLSPTLRHHVDQAERRVGAGTDQVVSETFSILAGWATDEVRPDQLDELDQLRQRLDASLSQVGRPVFLAFEQSAQIHKLQRIRTSLEAEKANLVEQVSSLSSSVDRLNLSLATANDENAELASGRDQLLRRVERAESQADQIMAENSRLLKSSKESQEKAEEHRRAAESARIERTELTLRLETTQLIVERSDAERDRALNQLNEARQSITGLTAAAARLEQRTAEVRRLELNLSQQNALAQARQKKIEHLQKDRSERLAGRDEKIVRLRTRLEQLDQMIVALENRNAQLADQLERATRFSPARLMQRISQGAQLVRGRAERARKQQLDLLSNSPLFDPSWYLARYPDVAAADLDPAVHYLDHGAAEGRSPSAAFHGQSYLNRYPDIREAGLNPLVHYVEHGQREGRKIRVVPAPDRPALASSLPAKQAPLSPAWQDTDPLPIEPWTARAIDFSGLADRLDGFTALNGIRTNTEEAEISVAGVCLAKTDLNSEQHAPPRAAVDWMEFLSFGADRPSIELEESVRSRLCGGQFEIEDMWFAADHALRLRLERTAMDAPAVIRAFQLKSDSSLAMCGETLSARAGALIFEVSLESHFRPVLVVATDTNGWFLDSCLIPFPSLARGGLHYAELLLQTESTAGRLHPQSLSAELLDSLANLPGEVSGLAVARIAIDLTDAIGNEPIFGDSMGEWLTQDLGLEFEPRNAGSATAWIEQKLMSIKAGTRTRGRRAGGATLYLPPNAIPTIQSLLAVRQTEDNGCISSFLIADRLSRDPIMQWNLPVHDRLSLQECDIPILQPSDEVSQCSAGKAVLAIYFRREHDTDARALFPVSRDAPLAIDAAYPANGSPERSISAIVSGEYDVASLRALCHSLEQQVGEFDVDLIVACPPTDGAVADLELPFRVQEVAQPGGSPWERFSLAADLGSGQKLLFLDGQAVLHDRRTLIELWALSEEAGVGSVSCTLVSEISGRKGAVHYASSVGYLAQLGLPADAPVFLQPVFHFSLLPRQLVLAANSQRCALMDRLAWQESATQRSSFASADPWLELGLELGRNGKANLCTTRVAASVPAVRSEPVMLPSASGPDDCHSSFAAFLRFRP